MSWMSDIFESQLEEPPELCALFQLTKNLQKHGKPPCSVKKLCGKARPGKAYSSLCCSIIDSIFSKEYTVNGSTKG